jgi:hypothetical protein
MAKKKVDQTDRVLKYINDFGSITRAQAFTDLGIANLTAVISRLRHDFGVNIVTDTIHARNRYNEKCSYAKYRIEEDKQ